MIHTYPLPLIEDVLAQLGKSTTFSALDLLSGFWQIRMALEEWYKENSDDHQEWMASDAIWPKKCH